MQKTLKNFKQYSILLLDSYSEIYFLKDYRFGLLVFLCSFASLNIGLSGLIAALAVLFIAHFLFSPLDLFQEGYLLYNSILVGMSIGFIFDLSYFSFFLIICTSFLTYLLSVFLKGFFKQMGVPILSLPFCLISILFYFSSKSFTTLYARLNYHTFYSHNLQDYLPESLSFLFKTLGSIIFNGDILIGIILFIGIIIKSRISLWHMILGLIIGHSYEHIIGSQSLYDLSFNSYSFNYMLVGVALGGVFLVASYRSLILLPFLIGMTVVITSGLHNILQLIHIPIFALPFNLTVILSVYSLNYFKSWLLPVVYGDTPEDTINLNISYAHRSSKGLPALEIPFQGKCSIYQGFDGEWTHKGKWKHALDFTKKDKEGKNYQGDGLNLNDYYTFGESVYSPIQGQIISVRDNIEDNPIGSVNTQLNWGNFIIIYSDFGYYVVLSHLKRESLNVHVGEYVQKNQKLALCGNSGYSPEPHLHMQVQYTSVLGDETRPFVISSYIDQDTIHSFKLPKLGDLISAPPLEKGLKNMFSLILDDLFEFEIEDLETNNKDKLNLIVKMNPNTGLFFLKDKKNNKLFFHLTDDFLYFDNFEGKSSHLKTIFSSLPKIPLFYKEGLSWSDHLPFHPQTGPWKKGLIDFLSAHTGKAFSSEIKMEFLSHMKVKSYSSISGKQNETLIILDPIEIIKEIKTPHFLIKRCRS